jgi:hypothetical protein
MAIMAIIVRAHELQLPEVLDEAGIQALLVIGQEACRFHGRRFISSSDEFINRDCSGQFNELINTTISGRVCIVDYIGGRSLRGR